MLGSVKRIEAYEQMKLMMYDGHDTQAVNMLSWLHPTNIEYPQATVYATQVSAELYYSQSCLELGDMTYEQKRAECFSV